MQFRAAGDREAAEFRDMDFAAALDAAELDAAAVVDLKLIDLNVGKVGDRRVEAQRSAETQGALVLQRRDRFQHKAAAEEVRHGEERAVVGGVEMDHERQRVIVAVFFFVVLRREGKHDRIV